LAEYSPFPATGSTIMVAISSLLASINGCTLCKSLPVLTKCLWQFHCHSRTVKVTQSNGTTSCLIKIMNQNGRDNNLQILLFYLFCKSALVLQHSYKASAPEFTNRILSILGTIATAIAAI
jgi:hypothetical protein